jgi:hypothetical protein
MAGLAGQKVRVTDSGYTGFTAGQKLRAADVPGGAGLNAGAILLASQG